MIVPSVFLSYSPIFSQFFHSVFLFYFLFFLPIHSFFKTHTSFIFLRLFLIILCCFEFILLPFIPIHFIFPSYFHHYLSSTDPPFSFSHRTWYILFINFSFEDLFYISFSKIHPSKSAPLGLHSIFSNPTVRHFLTQPLRYNRYPHTRIHKNMAAVRRLRRQSNLSFHITSIILLIRSLLSCHNGRCYQDPASHKGGLYCVQYWNCLDQHFLLFAHACKKAGVYTS